MMRNSVKNAASQSILNITDVEPPGAVCISINTALLLGQRSVSQRVAAFPRKGRRKRMDIKNNSLQGGVEWQRIQER